MASAAETARRRRNILGRDGDKTNFYTNLYIAGSIMTEPTNISWDISASPIEEPVVGQASVDRVEQLLDQTELAISLVQDRDSESQEGAGGEPAVSCKLSVVMPVYNEQATVDLIVRRVLAVDLDIELVIVDDGSSDGTRAVLYELEAEFDNVRVFSHETNRGKGAALRTGFANVTGDLVIVQDADLEYDPADYMRLVEPVASGEADVVYGSRYLDGDRQDGSFFHRLGNRLLTGASNLFTGQRLSDMETCYKVFRRDVLSDMTLRQNRFGFEPEVTAKLARRGLKIQEVPIHYNSRDYSEGKKIGWRDALSALYCIVRYRFVD